MKKKHLDLKVLIDYKKPFLLFDSNGKPYRFEDAQQAMEKTGLNKTEFTFMVTESRTVKGWTGMQE